MTHEQRLDETRRFWDAEAAVFDEQPDHGLRDPRVLRAWTNCLARWLPAPGAAVLDVGCGTGSLSVVMAALGHRVTAVDLSPAMIVGRRPRRGSTAGRSRSR